ncbi:MAG TPA: phytanoyl-CoA dioxygenase family protein, partial [Rhodospirillales bacterium]|nr:phytanoyl-CoA dioxygenase family protein [Rhodospirillales bacterium]
MLFKEKVNFKMPGGGGFKPHQDSQAGWDKYADFYVSALVSIDEATVKNGCLQL